MCLIPLLKVFVFYKSVSFGLLAPRFSVLHECCDAFDSPVQASHTLNTVQQCNYLLHWGDTFWYD